MRLRTLYLLVLPVLAYSNSSRAVDFEKIVLTDKYYCDGITAADINSDGRPDIVAGPFWYEGPDFKLAHAFYEPVLQPLAESPSNSMFSFVHDFSGDGRPDILVLGRVHKHAAMWYENPGESAALWKSHFAFERVRGESPTLADLNGDGVIGGADLADLLSQWSLSSVPGDLDGDGTVAGGDLAILLANWGFCS